MKKTILFLSVLLSCSQAAFAYDFSAVAPSGQTLYYNINGGDVTVVSYYQKPVGNLIIPATVTRNGITYSVTSIDDYAFSNSTGLTSVTIPNTVTSIGESAFSSCTGLTSVVFNADSCTFAGNTYSSNRVFYGCTNITSFTFGNSVKVIPAYLCCYLSGLTSVTIPNSVIIIGDYAFYECNLGSVTIGSSVTRIGNYAFSDCAFTSVTIPNSVTSIGNGAFSHCWGMHSVTIGDSVKIIGDYAFFYCGLRSVTIPNSVTRIGEEAFSNCYLLTSVVFNADSCTYAGRYDSYNAYHDYADYRAFYNCPDVTSFTFGNNVKIIPDYLCYGKTYLDSVTIPESVTSIGRCAFYNCTGLTSVVFNADSCFYAGWSSTGDTTAAFRGCSNITSFVFGSNVKSIPNLLCSGLTGLTSVTIPDSVSHIGLGAFSVCTGLTSLTIPNSVTNIGNSAFSHCTGLTSVTIGNSVTSISNNAFNGCTHLRYVEIPNSVTSIGNSAFSGCTRLTSTRIGNSVTSIAYHAFYDCYLSLIIFSSPTPPTIGSGISSTFTLNPSYVVKIPCGSLSQYAAIIPSSHLQQMDYGFSAVSADTSTGAVNILTYPHCTNPNAVLSAVPADGYRFDHWSTGSTNNPYTLTVTRDTTIIAFFVRAIYTLTTNVNDANFGSVSFPTGDTANFGDTLMVVASPTSHYHVDNWSGPGIVTTSTNKDTVWVVMNGNRTIMCNFAIDKHVVTTSIAQNDTACGSVIGDGVFDYGTTITLIALTKNGYRFDHWSTGSTDNPYMLTVTSDTTITAYYVSSSGTEGIGEIDEDDIRISVSGGCIFVEGITNEELRVYDITGRMVQNRSLPSGVYIVKIGTLPAQKVVVMR